MAESRIRFTPVDWVFLLVAGFTALIVAGLTLLLESISSNLPGVSFLAIPLFPGLITGLMITGAHGGTAAQEAIAPWVAAFVNGITYAIVIFVFRVIWRYAISKSAKRVPAERKVTS
jgi:hypothetical protein